MLASENVLVQMGLMGVIRTARVVSGRGRQVRCPSKGTVP